MSVIRIEFEDDLDDEAMRETATAIELTIIREMGIPAYVTVEED